MNWVKILVRFNGAPAVLDRQIKMTRVPVAGERIQVAPHWPALEVERVTHLDSDTPVVEVNADQFQVTGQ